MQVKAIARLKEVSAQSYIEQVNEHDSSSLKWLLHRVRVLELAKKLDAIAKKHHLQYSFLSRVDNPTWVKRGECSSKDANALEADLKKLGIEFQTLAKPIALYSSAGSVRDTKLWGGFLDGGIQIYNNGNMTFNLSLKFIA